MTEPAPAPAPASVSAVRPLVRPRAAFFDLDGTLMDREPLMQAALERVGIEHGHPYGRDELGVLVGRAWQDVFAALEVEARLGLRYDAFLAAVMRTAEGLLLEGFPTKVLDGGVELVARLHGQGVPVMLVTGSLRREADAAIHHLGIAPYLVGSLAAEEYGAGKPAPECYLAAAAAVAVDPTDGEALAACLVFEDSEPGVRAGLAAGMRVIASAAANRPAGHPSHQRLDAAHAVVGELTEVTDELVVSVLTSG